MRCCLITKQDKKNNQRSHFINLSPSSPTYIIVVIVASVAPPDCSSGFTDQRPRTQRCCLGSSALRTLNFLIPPSPESSRTISKLLRTSEMKSDISVFSQTLMLSGSCVPGDVRPSFSLQVHYASLKSMLRMLHLPLKNLLTMCW